MIFEPLEITNLSGCGSYYEITIGCFASNSEVGFNAAALIEPLRVDKLANRHRHVVCRHIVDDLLGIGTLENELAE